MAIDRKNMTTKNAGMTTTPILQSPTNPIMTVISDHAMSEPVISHFFDSRSPIGPAMSAMPAKVQLKTVLIQPIWTSVKPSSS